MSRFVPTGTYTGAELAPSTARPGAHDAARIPSLMHGQRVTREQQREQLHAPLPAAAPLMSRPPTRVTVPEGATAAPIPVRQAAPARAVAAPVAATTPPVRQPAAESALAVDFLDITPARAPDVDADPALESIAAAEALRLLCVVTQRLTELTALMTQLLQHVSRAHPQPSSTLAAPPAAARKRSQA